MSAGAGTSPFTQIGQIARSHGLKGELRVLFDTDNVQPIQQLQMVYLRNARGDFFPCRITHLRVEGKGNQQSFFVQFETIADRNSADSLKGKAIYLETVHANGLNLWEEESALTYDDFEIINEHHKHIGLVTDEMDNGAQLVLSVATTSGTLLIPVVEQFVEEIDEENAVIRCKNLDLLEGN